MCLTLLKNANHTNNKVSIIITIILSEYKR